MSAEIIPFDFEEQAVRVVIRDGEPWFVAVDVCRVLELENARQVVARLDDDERDGVHTVDAIGRQQLTNVINESGLYALIFTSRKEQAKRFRKWVTAEVLPTIRKTGRYELPGQDDTLVSNEGTLYQSLTHRDANMWLNIVREARVTRGTAAAVAMWSLSPLPPLLESRQPGKPGPSAEDGAACLGHLLGSTHEGRTVAEWVHDARGTEIGAYKALAGIGLRALETGLFVASGSIPQLYALFKATPWVHGKWRAALLAMPGVTIPSSPLTLAGIASRGVIVPWTLIPVAEV